MARFLSAGKGISRTEGRPTLEINSVEEARKAVQTTRRTRSTSSRSGSTNRDGKVDKVLLSVMKPSLTRLQECLRRHRAHLHEIDGKRLIRAGLDAFAHSGARQGHRDEMLSRYKSKPNLVVTRTCLTEASSRI